MEYFGYKMITLSLIMEAKCQKRSCKKHQTINSSHIERTDQLSSVHFNTMDNITPTNPLHPQHQETEMQKGQESDEHLNSEEREEVKELPVKERKMNQRDITIKNLRETNQIITNEVQSIWQKLKDVPKTHNKKRKLIESQDTYQKLQKDLHNAHHWIKIVQKELTVHKKRQKDSQNLIENFRRHKKELAERESTAAKLKSQIYVMSRQIKDKEKGLLMKSIVGGENNDFKNLTQEMSHMLGQLQQAERREEGRVNVLTKQYGLIKKMQAELLQKGVTSSELQQMKKRCIRQVPRKESSSKQSKDKILPQIEIKQQKAIKRQKRTKKKFQQMISEITLLKKKQTQFQFYFSLQQNQRNTYLVKNKSMRTQINENESKIYQLEQLSQKLRTRHIKQYRNKVRLKSLEVERQEKEKQVVKKQRMSLIVEQHKNRTRRFKSVPSVIPPLDLTQLKSSVPTDNVASKKRQCVFGQHHEGSNKFNDKHLLSQQAKKMVGIVVYLQPQRCFISGVSVTYEGQVRGGEHILKSQQNNQLYHIQRHECGDGFIKDMHAQFVSVDQRERLRGVGIQLSDGKHKYFGEVKPFQSQLSQNQYVSNMFGSMGMTNHNEHNISVIEQLGMEIYQ